ncbi:MAG: hypothetical protein B7Z37_29530 [Verrucomicrobia bacterium 12-59-8]|nr:MAG: hypothetical protein B7Z37_29530 [Verrucomicrobia bacterium 12-59-8]
MIPELFLATMWFAFVQSFPGVEAVYISAVGFDARAIVVIGYALSIVLRVVGKKKLNKALGYIGGAFSLVAVLISISVIREAHATTSAVNSNHVPSSAK